MTFKELIKKSGKTRTQLIAEIGCSQSYFSLLENDQRSVGKTYLTKASAALGVEPGELRPDLVAELSAILGIKIPVPSSGAVS